MAAEDRAGIRMIVSGRVQGVFFRHSTRIEAQRLAIKGWVRNLPSGKVEIVAEGTRDALRALAIWARQGPPGAHVIDVEEQWSEPTGEFTSFNVR